MVETTHNLPLPPCLTALTGLLPDYPDVGEIYLVGGAVRDLLLGYPPVDFDFTSEDDPTPLARAFAKQCGGHWFWLDERRRQSRVGIADGTYDFAPWRAPTLAGDLASRDFTINAMAIDLAGPLSGSRLIDPLGGRDALRGKLLLCAGPGVLHDDPLRVLKGIRHAVELGLEIPPPTLAAMQSASRLLTTSAPERLRLEIWRIFGAPAACRGLTLLVDCGAGEALFGRDFCSGLVVVQAALSRTNALFQQLSTASPPVAGWLREPVEQGMDRATLLRWCLALAAVKEDLPLMVAHRWRFSRAALSRIAPLNHLSPQLWQEALSLPRRPRPVALWALQHGPDPVDWLLALGLSRAEEPDRVAALLSPLLNLVACLPEPGRVPPLIDGNWLRNEYGLEGVELGAALSEVRRAEIRGIVASAEEARQYLAGSLRKNC